VNVWWLDPQVERCGEGGGLGLPEPASGDALKQKYAVCFAKVVRTILTEDVSLPNQAYLGL